MTFELTKDEPPEPILSLTVRQTASETVVELGGDLDTSTVHRLTGLVRQMLDQRRPHPPLVLDLAELRFIDATGTAALIWTRKSVGELILRNPPPVVDKVFTISGLAGTFTIQSDQQVRD